MEHAQIRDKAARLPVKLGVYLFKDRKGAVIYVGQSTNLRKRVSSYFQSTSRRSRKTNELIAQITDFDFVVAPSSLEAQKLERQLIKEHQPKYNRIRLTPQFIAERQKQILDAAAKVFAAKGYERATIADIARAAGIAEGSIYNYFKNKGDLLISIPRRAIQPPVESVIGRMRIAGAAPIPPEQMLPIIAKNMTMVFRQNGHIFRILMSALPRMSRSAREQYLNRVIFYAWDIPEAYFRELIEKGILRRELNPAILTRAFVGMFLPFVMLRDVLQVETDADWSDDQLIADLVPLFLGGVLAIPTEGKSK